MYWADVESLTSVADTYRNSLESKGQALKENEFSIEDKWVDCGSPIDPMIPDSFRNLYH